MLDCRDTATQVIVQPLHPGNQTLRLAGVPDGALWQIDEAGVEFVVSATLLDTDAELQVGGPPARLGRLLGPAHEDQELRISGRPATSTLGEAGTLQLHCRPDEATQMLLACSGLTGPPRAGSGALASKANATRYCAARTLHAAALQATREDQPMAAESLLQRAAELWHENGEPARRAAALVHHAESLWRRGAHQPALAAVDIALAQAQSAANDYYTARAHNQRCLLLRGLGDYEQARTCSDDLPQRFLDLGEFSEAANALANQAAMANEDSQPEVTRTALAKARALPAEALTPMVRGRLDHVEASLESNHGRAPQALALLERALHHFERADSSAWQSSAYLHAARLHAALGAWAEARLLAASAERIGAELAMPERHAAAAFELARILAASGDPIPALDYADRAMTLADGSNPQTRLDIAVLGWTLNPSPAREQQVEALAAKVRDWTPRLRFDLTRARALNALADDDSARAQTLLDSSDAEPPDLHRQIEYERLRARIEAQAGNPLGARERLRSAIARVSAMAAEASAPPLRQMIGRRLLQLRAEWIDTLSEAEFEQSSLAESMAAIVLATDPGALLRPNAEYGKRVRVADDAVDRSLARALSGTGDDTDLLVAQRDLWVRYGRPTDNDDPADTVQPLPYHLNARADDTAVLIIGLGERQSVLVLHRADQWRMLRLDDAATLRHSAHALIENVSDRSTAMAQIEAAAQQLTQHLFPKSLGDAPGHLLILVDESLAAVPFNLLTWPGQDAPLLETSHLSRIAISTSAESGSRSSDQPGIDVLVSAAAIDFEREDGLPALYAAELESGWIAGAAPKSIEIRTDALREPALIERLRTPHAWVHIAGHGTVLGGLQGHAGLWAVPEAGNGQRPRFVSWLTLLDQPLSAQLVVLNACALGETGAATHNQASSFAGALQAAGVEHVVAALWPVSDSAAAVWIPSFYSALLADGGEGGHAPINPAAALREAQLHLRASRAFRHPFYWASLSHYTAL